MNNCSETVMRLAAPRPGFASRISTLPTQRAGRPTLAIYAYFLVLIIEMVAHGLFDSDVVIGAAVTVTLLVASLCAIFESLPAREIFREPLSWMAVGYTAALVVVGLYLTLGGVLLGNNRYYLAADAYHWFAEGVAMLVLGLWVLRRCSAAELYRFVLNLSMILGVLGLTVALLGTLGVAVAGGHRISSLGIWRLELSRGYPSVLLMFVLAATLWCPPHCRIPKGRLLVVLALLAVSLLLTFKRTQWISMLAVAPLLVVGKRGTAVAAYFAALFAVIVLVLAGLFPEQARTALLRVGDAITYSRAWTLDESIGRRVEQLEGLWHDRAAGLLGAGFGAEHIVFVPRLQQVGYVHYVHNLYWYYLLQMGWPVAIISLLLFASLFYALGRSLRASSPWSGMARASLCGITMLALGGFMLLSTHTAFAGFLLAVGLLALRN